MIGLDNLDGVINIIREASSNANASSGLVRGRFLYDLFYFLFKFLAVLLLLFKLIL